MNLAHSSLARIIAIGGGLLLTLLASLALTAPVASADEEVPPLEVTSMTVSDDEVYPNEHFYVYANLNRNILGSEVVTIKLNGNPYGSCGSWPNAYCSVAVDTTWAMNGGDTDLVFTAEVSGSNAPAASLVVHVNRFHFSVDLTTSQNIPIGETANVHAQITYGAMWGTPYTLKIRDDSTGAIVAACNNWWNACDYGYTIPWDDNRDPRSHQFSAYLGNGDDTDMPSNVATASVTGTPRTFGVAISAAPSVKIGESTNIHAELTQGSMSGTIYMLKIKDETTGQIVAACWNWWNACDYSFTPSWSENGNPVPHTFSAFMEREDGTHRASNIAETSVGVDPYSFEVSLTSSEESVRAGESTWLHAAITSGDMWPTPYRLYIRDEESGLVVAGCYNWWNTCDYRFDATWEDDRGDGEHRFSAFVALPDFSHTASNSAPRSVAIAKRHYDVELTANQESFSAPGMLELHATATGDSLPGTPYSLKIRDDETGDVVASCSNWEGVCDAGRSVSWDDVTSGSQGTYTAFVGVDGEAISEEPSLEFAVEPPGFEVGFEIGDRQSPNEPVPLDATATSTPSIFNAPLRLAIRNDIEGSQPVATCNNTGAPGTHCEALLGPGTYFAAVETLDDEPVTLGRSGSFTIWDDGSVTPGDLAGIDLASLANGFGSAVAVCMALVGSPYATSFVPPATSLSDQQEACEEVAAAGGTALAALRAALFVAGAAIGGKLAWWLLHYGGAQHGQTTPELFPPSAGPETAPNPPETWPGALPQSLRDFVERNAATLKGGLAAAATVYVACRTAMMQILGNPMRCDTDPVFFSGRITSPQATAHDWSALRRDSFLPNLDWIFLRYKSRPDSAGKWKNGYPECLGRTVLRPCDEFPYLKTEEGGGEAYPVPSLKIIDRSDNSRQGASWGAFLSTCGVRVSAEKAFINVPMPPGTFTPSMYVCNGHSKLSP